MNLTDPVFADADKAREHLEKTRWPNGSICSHCGVVNEATHVGGKAARKGVYQCNACREQFSGPCSKAPISLNKWLRRRRVRPRRPPPRQHGRELLLDPQARHHRDVPPRLRGAPEPLPRRVRFPLLASRRPRRGRHRDRLRPLRGGRSAAGRILSRCGDGKHYRLPSAGSPPGPVRSVLNGGSAVEPSPAFLRDRSDSVPCRVRERAFAPMAFSASLGGAASTLRSAPWSLEVWPGEGRLKVTASSRARPRCPWSDVPPCDGRR